MNLTDKNFLIKVEEYTSNQLQRKDDIQKIIDAVSANGKEEQFGILTFTAKYICGLMRVLKVAPGIPEVNSINQIKSDLNENIKKGIEQLKEIIYLGEANDQDYFNETYFTLSSQNFSNVTQLFSDLESIKKYINHLKR